MEMNSAYLRRTLVVAAYDAGTRQQVQEQLGMQWVVLLAAHVRDALQLCEALQPGIAAVIIDQNMLLLHGLALIEQVRSIHRLMPIMLYTPGRANEVLIRWCEKYGVIVVATAAEIALESCVLSASVGP